MAYKEYSLFNRGSKVLQERLQGIDGRGASLQMGGIDLEQTLKKFISELNDAVKDSHKTAAISYFLAGLTALVSLFIS